MPEEEGGGRKGKVTPKRVAEDVERIREGLDDA